MAEALPVSGYHGTSVAGAASILRDGFRLSRNEYDWLGDGVYFFQDAPARAWEWATTLHGSDAAVIHSLIRLEDCIDLRDIEWFTILADAHVSFLKLAEQTSLPFPRQTPGAHRLDREVVNHAVWLLAQRRITIRAVRGAFAEGAPVFPGSAILRRSHIQVAVRDVSLIETSALVTR